MVNLKVFHRMPSPGADHPNWGYLGNAYVRADHRDKGIGGMLMNALLAHAREQGFHRIVLNPTERSVPYYRRAGFEPADRLMVKYLHDRN